MLILCWKGEMYWYTIFYSWKIAPIGPPTLILLPNFLMFCLFFLPPYLTFPSEFGIVMANPQFVDSEHSRNTCNPDFELSSGSPQPTGDGSPICSRMSKWEAHKDDIFDLFEAGQSGQMLIVFNDGSNSVRVDFSFQSLLGLSHCGAL